jgi:hypothetical protein
MNKVIDILDAIVALDDDGIDFLFQMLDHGMWDEWDTSLVGGLSIGFGPAEMRIAVRSSASFAKHIDKHTKED